MSNSIIPDKQNIVFIATKIKLENKTGVFIYGTGFIVKKNDKMFVVSCEHIYKQIPETEKKSMFCGVVSPDTKDYKKIRKYGFYDIHFFKHHKEKKRDLCLFKFDDSEKVETEIKSYGYSLDIFLTESELEDKTAGESISFAGYPLANELLQQKVGLTLALDRAIISDMKYSGADERIDFIFINKTVNPGSSGSPVFLGDKIIGIASATLNRSHVIGSTFINVPVEMGIVRPSNYILELFDSVE